MTDTIAAGARAVLHEHVLVLPGAVQGWRDDVAVIVLAVGAALFVIAGVVRLARWRLTDDAHCALTGSALIVMGALYLPLVGVAEVSGALRHHDLGEAVLRALVTAIAAGLLLGAVGTTTRRPRPTRLLPVLAVLVLATFAGLAVGQLVLPHPLPHEAESARVLSAAMVLTWILVAVVVRTQGPPRPWTRRTPPLLGALAVAEALYGSDPGEAASTGAALAVCATVAGAAAWSAKQDLDTALHQTEHTIGSLSDTLRDVRDETVELTEWRARLVHDATNAVLGLQAALDVLNARQGPADPLTADLCAAASEEVHHLDHLLHRAPDAPVGPFDAGAVVRGVATTARVLGQDVSVTARDTWAVGRPGDLVVVLKNLLGNAARHAPGARVHLGVERTGERVRIVCRDHGPGVDERVEPHVFERGFRGPASEGSGLGLYGARMVMREQGGDLVLEHVASGARFVAVLPAASRACGPVAGRRTTGVPVQRRAPETALRAGSRVEPEP